MGNHRKAVLAAAVAFAAISAFGRADSITLDSGKVIQGTIVRETDKAVEISAGGITVTIPRVRVKEVVRSAERPTTKTVTLDELESLELKGLWPDLYEAATELLRREPKNTVAAEKQKLAAKKIRESLGEKKIAQLCRDRKFDEAIALLTNNLRRSGLLSRGAGAVGKRALAELRLAKARYLLHSSTDGHKPLAEARKARKLDPTTPGLDYIEGWAQMNLHDFNQAIRLLERAERADPENFGIRILLMRCYKRTGNFLKIVLAYESAPADFGAAARRWPEIRRILRDAYLQMALRSADRGTTAQAAAAYEKYLDFCEPTLANLRDAIDFFKRIGDRERAARLRREGLRAIGSSPTTASVEIRQPL